MGSGALSAGPPPPPTPHKKMKKRKELNALIGLSGDGGRKKPKKSSGHRLLRTEPPASDSDTDTEEEEEDGFGPLGDRPFRCRSRGSLLHCCQLCYPFCAFLLLTACALTCIGLVWMQVALKESMDALREQFKAMESSQRNSFQELPRINDDLQTKQKHLDDIVSGDQGLNTLWTNITEMNKQIAMLTTAVNQLKTNLKSASDLINLPKTMEDLQKSVASLGSTLTSVHHDVETMQTAAEEQKKQVESLQKDVAGVTMKLPPTSSLTGPDITEVESLNATMLDYLRHSDLRLHDMDNTVSNISQRVSILESSLLLGYKAENNSSMMRQSPASDIQEQLQLIQALTSNPDGDTADGRSDRSDAVTSRPFIGKTSPRSVKRKRSRRGLFLPRIVSEEYLTKVFRESPQGLHGKLSFEDLRKLLGSRIPPQHSLQEYDVDGDNLLCLTELKNVLAV